MAHLVHAPEGSIQWVGYFPALLVNPIIAPFWGAVIVRRTYVHVGTTDTTKPNQIIKTDMRDAKHLTKFFSEDVINEIKLVSIRNSIRDIVKKSLNNGYKVTDNQHDAMVKAKKWVYRHRKSRGVLGKPAKIKVFTKEEIEKYQSGAL